MINLLLTLWVLSGAAAYCIEQDKSHIPFTLWELAKACFWGPICLYAVLKGD